MVEGKLHEALAQISEIRYQMARTEVFRGYRAVPAAFTGVLAMVAAVVQSVWVPAPAEQRGAYLTLWLGAASIGVVVALLAMLDRQRRSESSWNRELTALALEYFAPSLVAGALLTLVLAADSSDLLWLLPGLWQVLFGIGLFATSRLLPRPIRLVAAAYLVTGITCLIVGRGGASLGPLAMGLPFGLGQTATAAILYWTLERPGERR
jgi:hypothetical protein